MNREAQAVLPAQETLEGEGMVVRRAIPNQGIRMLDPFLLLDHMGPRTYGPGEAKGAPDHPHRGFETVTYVLDGALEHKDSQGNQGRLEAGDVQWMTAGAGVVHSEMPAAEIRKDGGVVHGLQLWVNLPAKDKMMAPRYQEIPAQKIPEVTFEGGSVRVVAGAFQGTEAVIDTRTPITYLHARLDGDVELPVPEGHQGFVYVIHGHGQVAGEDVTEATMVPLGAAGDHVRLHAGPDGLEAILVSGVPIREPVIQYGPFVMNTRQEILQALQDFQAGVMGSIPAE